MIGVIDLDRLYQQNAPVSAGGKVERAIQLIRFCGSLYRDLRASYPDRRGTDRWPWRCRGLFCGPGTPSTWAPMPS